MSKSSKKKPNSSDLDGYMDAEEQRQQKQVSTRELRRLLGYVFKQKKLFFGGLLLIFAATAATLLEPRLLGYAIDEAMVPKDSSYLRKIAALFFVVECVRVSATIAQAYLFSCMGQYVMQDLRLALFSHLQRMPISTYDRNPAGRLVTRVTNDISALAEMFSAGFVAIIANFLTVLGILVWLFILDPKLAAVAIAVFPVLLVASAYFSAKLRIAYREARSKLSALNAFLAENLLGMRVVHLFNRQKLHLQRFSRVNQSYTEAQISSIKVFALFQPSITWAQGIAMGLLMWYGGNLAYEGNLKLGVLVAFSTYVASLFQPVREIADKWNLFLSGMASAERIFSVLDWPTELREEQTSGPPLVLPQIKGHIVFENVWFAYDAERWVLKDFSIEFKPGMRIGVVGHTGAGKTTLISLLMRYYDPQRGKITIDGRDIRDYDRRSLRAAIGIVQQDVFLFSGTLRDNITLGREQNAGMDSEALKDFAFFKSEDRMGQELFERGVNLSMGERQMIAFGRALSSNPQIWILDEATANVDSESEQELERSLHTFSKGRTTILIAHRLATVRTADLILVLHKGELVENGNHAALMKKAGIYSRLYRLQQAEKKAEVLSSTAVGAIPI